MDRLDDTQARAAIAAAIGKDEATLIRVLGNFSKDQCQRVLNGRSLKLLDKSAGISDLLWRNEGNKILILVDHGLAPNSLLGEDFKFTLLQKACRAGDMKIVEALFEKGASPNIISGKTTVFSMAAYVDEVESVELIKVLLAHGELADTVPETVDHDPLQAMAREENIQGALMLVAHGARGIAADGNSVFDRIRLWLTNASGEDMTGKAKWLGIVEAAVLERDLELGTARACGQGKPKMRL